MSFGAIFILAVGLAMDAFAVAVCKGLALKKISVGKALLVGAWFGGFQALMPFVGYLLGTGFEDKIKAVDHWITVAFLRVNIVMALSAIGVVTLVISAAGDYIGHMFGAKYKAKAELAGGIILILIGLRILLEHLGIF